MILKIWVTPTSITVADSNQNRLSVLKTTTGIEFQSSVANAGVNKDLLSLQETMKHQLLHPAKERDNYKARFNKLAKQIGEFKVDSFYRLNSLMTA